MLIHRLFAYSLSSDHLIGLPNSVMIKDFEPERQTYKRSHLYKNVKKPFCLDYFLLSQNAEAYQRLLNVVIFNYFEKIHNTL